MATVARVQRVDAVSEFGDSSDKGVNGDDSSEVGGDVGGTGGWPSTTANGYGESNVNICAIRMIEKGGKNGLKTVKGEYSKRRCLSLYSNASAYTNTVIVQKKWKSIP